MHDIQEDAVSGKKRFSGPVSASGHQYFQFKPVVFLGYIGAASVLLCRGVDTAQAIAMVLPVCFCGIQKPVFVFPDGLLAVILDLNEDEAFPGGNRHMDQGILLIGQIVHMLNVIVVGIA